MPGFNKGFNKSIKADKSFEHDLTKALNKAKGEDKDGKHWGIMSQNGNAFGAGGGYRDQGFLSDSFPRTPPRLYVTAESDDFDLQYLQDWRNEGFRVEYLPIGPGGTNAYTAKIEALSQKTDLAPCETFGIIAFGDAASICLEHFHIMQNNPEFRLGLLIAYYPTRIPDPRAKFPSSIRVLVHLCEGDDIGISSRDQLIGIQGKRKIRTTKVDRGVGTGGSLLNMAYPAYSYGEGATDGFAEPDLDEYDPLSAELSWSRSLAAARKAFQGDPGLEATMEKNTEAKFKNPNPTQIISTYALDKDPHTTFVPTLTGAIGAEDLTRFYNEFFFPGGLDDGIRQAQQASLLLKTTLLSRTASVNRVVDELHVSFKHVAEVPWLLPGIPATGRRIEVVLVSIVSCRAGRLVSEHVYWDQASVLLQAGVLDIEKGISDKARKKGVKRLPIVGKQGARRMLTGLYEGEDGEADNELLDGWYSDEEEGEEEGEEEDYYDEGEEEEEDGALKTEDDEEDDDEVEVETELDNDYDVFDSESVDVRRNSNGKKNSINKALLKRGPITSSDESPVIEYVTTPEDEYPPPPALKSSSTGGVGGLGARKGLQRGKKNNNNRNSKNLQKRTPARNNEKAAEEDDYNDDVDEIAGAKAGVASAVADHHNQKKPSRSNTATSNTANTANTSGGRSNSKGKSVDAHHRSHTN